MPDIDDIWDDEEDRAAYATRAADGLVAATAATPEDDDAESFDDIRLDRIGKLMSVIADEHAEKDRQIERLRAEIERLTAENAAKAIELKAANSKIERMRKAAEGTDQWANEVIAAICKHVGVDDADDGFTAADLASLLEEHNAEFDAIGARATAAEAALAAMEGEALDWREVATSNAKERDAAQERGRAMREALTVACKWGITSANYCGSVAADLRDWIAAGCAGPFPADMLKVLGIIDPDLRAALSAKEATDVR